MGYLGITLLNPGRDIKSVIVVMLQPQDCVNIAHD